MAIGEQRCCRSGGPAFYLCPRALAAMSFVFSLFPAFCLSGVLGLREGGGSRPDSRPLFFCLAKRNGGKKRRALQAACPAKLTALLRRAVQTAAGNLNFYMEARQSCRWRAVVHKRCALNSLSRLRVRVRVRGYASPSPVGGRQEWKPAHIFCFLFCSCQRLLHLLWQLIWLSMPCR